MAPPAADEFEWDDVSCDGCSMNPIIGQRYRCPTCDNYDLCSTCNKKGHEHPLELVPQSTEEDEDWTYSSKTIFNTETDLIFSFIY